MVYQENIPIEWISMEVYQWCPIRYMTLPESKDFTIFYPTRTGFMDHPNGNSWVT